MAGEGKSMYMLARRLFPICRSITGDGVRETFDILREYDEGLALTEVPSDTQVFDWEVPREWVIRDAYIEDGSGARILDFKENNLHVLGYSAPADEYLTLSQLKEVVYTQEEYPDVVPYRTSYYKERYGFCMSENQKNSLAEGIYHAVVDSELKEGSLTYGEIVIPGETKREIFFSTYICHPSMANNECSGPSLAVHLAAAVRAMSRRKYTYRFVFVPETIGAITYISRNLAHLKEHMAAGFVLTCVGDDRTYSHVESRYADTLADRALRSVLRDHFPEYKTYSYIRRGSDERQYCAPGVDLPVCAFCRSKFGEYPEYHTSADNMDILSEAGFQGSFDVMMQVVAALEYNEYYQVTCLCEPQLGRRGLYPDISISGKEGLNAVTAIRDIIGYADGQNDLFDLSERIGVPVKHIIPFLPKLLENGLFRIKD